MYMPYIYERLLKNIKTIENTIQILGKKVKLNKFTNYYIENIKMKKILI